MKTTLTVLASVALSLIGTYILVAFVPLSFFPDIVKHTFGTSVTTINGSDTLSSSRTTLNTNFTNLNNGKLETSVTTLPLVTTMANLVTVGTITSGTWTGTVIGVPYGGTGTTSPTLNQLMLGNSGSGLKVVNGFGSSGQALVSNGAGVAPSWGSVSSLNGVSYTFPAAQAAASSTVMLNDGSGNLYWSNQGDRLLYHNTNVSSSTPSIGATTTLTVVRIPANTLTSSNSLRVTGQYINTGASGTCASDLSYGNGSSTTTVGFIIDNMNAVPLQIQANIYATSTSKEAISSLGTNGFSPFSATQNNFMLPLSAVTSFSTAANTYVAFGARVTSGNGGCGFIGGTIEVLSI